MFMLKPNFVYDSVSLYITVPNTVASRALFSQRLPGPVLGSCSPVVAGWVCDSSGQGSMNICEMKYLSFYE